MSWTQGVQIREDADPKEVKILDALGVRKFGEGYVFQAYVWDEAEPGILYFDYQNEAGDYRSLKYTYDKNKAGMV